MFFVCPNADFAVQAVGDLDEIHKLLSGPTSSHAETKCPECGTPIWRASAIDQEVQLRVREVFRTLTPHEVYLALEGLGFPEERVCTAEAASELFRTQRVTKTHIIDILGTGRSVVDHIVFEDGTTLFLSGSAWGAIIYRIRKPRPYANKELK